jgi:hypothetical protein
MADERILGIESDKFSHALGGFTGQVICEAIANHAFKEASPFSKSLSCFLIVNSLGVAKELTDPLHGGTREPGDVFANMVGSGLAIPVIKWGF